MLFSLLTLSGFAAHSQQFVNLSGKITNVNSVPIEGSSVHLINTNRGTVSDEHGNFNLKNVAAGNYIIKVLAIGYATVNLAVTVGGSSAESLNI